MVAFESAVALPTLNNSILPLITCQNDMNESDLQKITSNQLYFKYFLVEGRSSGTLNALTRECIHVELLKGGESSLEKRFFYLSKPVYRRYCSRLNNLVRSRFNFLVS